MLHEQQNRENTKGSKISGARKTRKKRKRTKRMKGGKKNKSKKKKGKTKKKEKKKDRKWTDKSYPYRGVTKKEAIEDFLRLKRLMKGDINPRSTVGNRLVDWGTENVRRKTKYRSCNKTASGYKSAILFKFNLRRQQIKNFRFSLQFRPLAAKVH